MNTIPILDLSALFAPRRDGLVYEGDEHPDADAPSLFDQDYRLERARRAWDESGAFDLSLLIVNGVFCRDELYDALYLALRKAAKEQTLPAGVAEAWNAIRRASIAAEADVPESEVPRFADVSCSHCGGHFGPGDNGFSHCENHAHLRRLA